MMGSISADDKMAATQSLLQKTGKTQAAFVPKLYQMVKNMKQPTAEDPNPEQPLIFWSKADVFSVFDPIQFSRIILPMHFKHNNWQSFVRQLNMYGFHKVNDLLSSSHCQTDSAQAWEFRHPHFRRDRPDLLPMIKRKSTKHHGSSKPSNSPANVQATSQVGKIHLQRQMPPTDGVSGCAARAVEAYIPHNRTGPILPSAHRPLHGKPPPPPSLHAGKANHLTNLPPRAPVLYPILTHQFQYTHSAHSQLKSSPPLQHSNNKGSSSTRANPQTTALNPCSPHSARLPANPGRPISSQSQDSRRFNVEEEEVAERRFAWSSMPAACSSDSSLSRIEDELRRLNHTLTHRNPSGNHIFSMLGLIVELVTLLVDNQEVRVAPAQQEKLSRYVQTAKEALGKLEASNLSQHDSFRRCSGAPSTDSMSPISTDPVERDRCKNFVDSNLRKTIDGSSSAICIARPRWSDRIDSPQSLPPINTMMAQCAPPVYNRTHSSGALPASINRLMNAQTEEYPKMAANSEEDQEDSQEDGDDEDDEEEGEEGEDSDGLGEEANNANYDDDGTDDDDANEGKCGHDQENYGDANDLINAEPHSEGDQQSFSDQLSSNAASTPEGALQGNDAESQCNYRNGELTNIHSKRPYNDSANITEPTGGENGISTLQVAGATDRTQKRIRSDHETHRLSHPVNQLSYYIARPQPL